jgi:hypothetical protein
VHNLGAEDLLALATLRAAAAAVHKHAHAGPVTQLELADAAANLCYNADNLVPAAAAAEEPASATFNFADAAATLKPHSSHTQARAPFPRRWPQQQQQTELRCRSLNPWKLAQEREVFATCWVWVES